MYKRKGTPLAHTGGTTPRVWSRGSLM